MSAFLSVHLSRQTSTYTLHVIDLVIGCMMTVVVIIFKILFLCCFFKGKPIFSIDIHPDGSRFATGGQGNLFVFYILMLGLFIKQQALIMVTLWNSADHYILILSFVLLLLSFFPRLISAVAEWMSAILAHMVWP